MEKKKKKEWKTKEKRGKFSGARERERERERNCCLALAYLPTATETTKQPASNSITYYTSSERTCAKGNEKRKTIKKRERERGEGDCV